MSRFQRGVISPTGLGSLGPAGQQGGAYTSDGRYVSEQNLNLQRSIARQAAEGSQDPAQQEALARALFATAGNVAEEQTWMGRVRQDAVEALTNVMQQDMDPHAKGQLANDVANTALQSMATGFGLNPRAVNARNIHALSSFPPGSLPPGVDALVNEYRQMQDLSSQAPNLGVGGLATPAQQAAVNEMQGGGSFQRSTPREAVEKSVNQFTGPPSAAGLGDAMEPYAQARYQKAAAAMADLSEAMGQPGVTDFEIAQMRQQFISKYPDIAQTGTIPQPMTTRQVEQMRRETKLSQVNNAARELLSGKVPTGEFLEYDEKGNLKMIDGLRDALSILGQVKRSEQETATAQQRLMDQRFRKQMDLFRMGETPPEGTSREDKAYFELERQALQRELGQIENKLNQYGVGTEGHNTMPESIPGSSLAQGLFKDMPAIGRNIPKALQASGVGEREYATRVKMASDQGVAFVVDQDDYNALPSGAQYMDGETGEIFTKR